MMGMLLERYSLFISGCLPFCLFIYFRGPLVQHHVRVRLL